MPVYVPGKSQGAESIVPMVGSVVGGVFGGPAGAAIGGKVGGMATSSGPAPGAVQTSALSRRLEQPDEDPQTQLAQAAAALKQLPPEYQDQYGQTIATAQQRASQGGS